MLRSKLGASLNERGLKLVLALFFLALAVPTAVLIWQAWSQLKWEAFHQQRLVAEELAARIDARQIELIDAAEARSFADYQFLVVEGDPSANFLQRSPLSAFPVEAALPGLVGWFQVDAEGRFSTPLLPPEGMVPKAYGISEGEHQARLALEQQIHQVLSENRLVRRGPDDRSPLRPAMRDQDDVETGLSSTPRESAEYDEAASHEAPTASAYFDRAIETQAGADRNEDDRVSNARLESSGELERPHSATPSVQRAVPRADAVIPRAKRKEQAVVAEPLTIQGVDAPTAGISNGTAVAITTFESELDPFELSLLDSGHFVLYRTAWREGQRFIQGAIIEQQLFLEDLIGATIETSPLHRMSDLIVAYGGEVLNVFGGAVGNTYSRSLDELADHLYRTRLSAPLDSLGLIFSANQLPVGPGGRVLGWITLILALVFSVGFYGLYRTGLAQIRLTRQQQDFVSAVSHELKTPLTSIRMYGEMLKKGWADPEKKQAYYEYIYDESERLSRLISNVLQLARLTRSDPQMNMRPAKVAEAMDLVRSKIESQVEQAGFELSFHRDPDAENQTVHLDTDCLVQIVINLVDNAIKFSANADIKAIEIASRLQGKRKVVFSVRDYGPGIPKDQMRRIFRLFYRAENESSRETVGTGIGLALVDQLTKAMSGKVDSISRERGTEFQVSFPLEIVPDPVQTKI